MGKRPREDEDDGREDSGEERPRSQPTPPPLPDEGIREGPGRQADAEGEAPRRPRRPRRDDDDDDRPRRRPRHDGDVMSSLIPYKNGLALAAYYCGVFALIPCLGMILAVVAVIMGILGLNYARQHPDAKGGGHAIAGIVLGAFSLLGHIVVLLLILLSRRW